MNYWTDDEVARLRELADGTLTQRQIAQRLGRTKLSISRKLRLLGLQGAPIIKRTRTESGRFEPSRSKVERAGKSTLPPLASLQPVTKE